MVGFENMRRSGRRIGAAVSWSNSAGVALVAVYHGWMNIAPVAGEVQNPRYNIPMRALTGTMIIMVVYVSANFAYYLVMPGTLMTGLDAVNRPVAAAFGLRLLGPIGLMLASAAIMTSVFGALNGNMLVGPRLLFAMGQDPHASLPRRVAFDLADADRGHRDVRRLVDVPGDG